MPGANTFSVGEVSFTLRGERVLLENPGSGKSVELGIGELISKKGEDLDRLAGELGVKRVFDLEKAKYEAAALYLKSQPLRKSRSFERIERVFTKPKPPVLFRGELFKVEKEYTVYLAYWNIGAPPFILIDSDGYVNPRNTQYSIEAIDEEKIREILEGLPESVRKRIISVIEKWGIDVSKNKNEDETAYIARVAASASRLGVFYTPVPTLRDPSFPKTIDWRAFVDMAVNYGDLVDGRLELVRKMSFLKGVVMQYNPHFIVVTPSGWGKSTFYQLAGAGVHFSKATLASLLGYARGKKEIYEGALKDLEVPVVIDQMEAEAQVGLYEKLLDLMETGVWSFASGGITLTQKTRAILGFLANPLDMGSTASDFKYILEIISRNPAFGRRIGIIFYTREEKSYSEKPKMKESEIRNWREFVQTVRAVEEAARKHIYKIYESSTVENWLSTEIPGYEEKISGIIREAGEDVDETLIEFFRVHASGAQRRIRNAALRIAILYNLDKIVLGEVDIEGLLREAESYLERIISLNILSVEAIIKDVNESREYLLQAGFEGEPDYMKVIISAVELYRRSIKSHWGDGVPPKPLSYVNLSKLNYTPGYGRYNHISKALYKLRQKSKQIDNNRLQKLYGFQIIVQDSLISAHITDWSELPINPIGKIDDLQIMSFVIKQRDSVKPDTPSPVSPNSPFHQKVRKGGIRPSDTENTDNNHRSEKLSKSDNIKSQKTGASDNTPLFSQTGETVKMVKTVKASGDNKREIMISPAERINVQKCTLTKNGLVTAIYSIVRKAGSIKEEELSRLISRIEAPEEEKIEAIRCLEERGLIVRNDGFIFVNKGPEADDGGYVVEYMENLGKVYRCKKCGAIFVSLEDFEEHKKTCQP